MLDYAIRQAFSEVDAFLDILEYSYTEKIPTEILAQIKKQKANDYNPVYKKDVPLIMQSFKKQTLAIIAYLDLNYWCSTQEKADIQKEIWKPQKMSLSFIEWQAAF